MTSEEPTSTDVSTDVSELSVGRTGSTESLSLNERFEILKNERRRHVLDSLSSVDDSVALSTLADQIAAIENDTTVEAVSSAERKRVYVALYQFHLPKMDRMGVVEYDKDRGKVSLTDNGRSLYQAHEAEQGRSGYLDVLDICACAFGVLVLVVVFLTQAWVVGSVFLGVQTGLIGAKTVATRMM
jgi:hypothetical protein